MRVQFQNHASLIIENHEGYLLTDPWFNQPAFGSWLPTFPPYVHPAYLAALGSRISILISHAHDDHFDDRLLGLFDPNTLFITANFKSPAVINRLKSQGFENVVQVGEHEKEIRGFRISSFVVPEVSHDDAVYLIRDDKGALVHCNDMWHPFEEQHKTQLIERLAGYDPASKLLFSQTNSASGYPLTYRCFSEREQLELLEAKILKMVQGGLTNARTLGCDRLFSYAGFASVYVKGQQYNEKGFFPTARNLRDLLDRHQIEYSVRIADYFPGDVVTLPSGEITSAFVSNYSDHEIQSASQAFYEEYGNLSELLSYRVKSVWSAESNWEELLGAFLSAFNDFACDRVSSPDVHFSDLLGKSFSMEISTPSGEKVRKTIVFGKGLTEWNGEANETCYVNAAYVEAILRGEALFEDLTTGYLAEWERNPSRHYNKDIDSMITMFSYVYRNRLAAPLCKKLGIAQD